ncbi:NAD(P)H-hydrate dehydratase [uncultured Paludibaculum sp.]|uniref:NAD(P)H-hydrate dehydratase n=1 Tax=uncultured Paludibaculum sp. TaxID=1765020 RepID=UPI002AAAB9AA|nr:NAD(P)H-hydrate dehydratase [uncultured Paludibaculum sp.]
MKILTGEQMRAVDRLTMEAGIPGLVLMENAGCRFVEFLERHYAPLEQHRIVVICGKGNNGGDGLVIARQLSLRHSPRSLDVALAYPAEEFKADAAANWRMLQVAGVRVTQTIEPKMRAATLVIDALLGTGLEGPARGPALEWIREMNSGFPGAVVVSVDVPSGLFDGGESVRAADTVTFTAPKVEQAMPPTCDRVGRLHVAQIGTPISMLEKNPEYWLNLVEPRQFRRLFEPRPPGAHKGDFGHVLVIGGAPGKGGAAAMSGLAALKMGAGLVTVATSEEERRTVTALAPELMTQSLDEDPGQKDVLAIGPGLGREPELAGLAQRLFAQSALPLVMDADGLNALAGTAFHGPGPWRVLTPHPGEMSRLAGCKTTDIQADRVGVARGFAMERNVVLVLKGQRTITAFPDGRVYVNPSGTPAMASAGSGDILTGLIAGLMAQWPDRRDLAVLAAVWLHGRAGELGAAAVTEQSLTATDLIRYLPAAIREVQA